MFSQIMRVSSIKGDLETCSKLRKVSSNTLYNPCICVLMITLTIVYLVIGYISIIPVSRNAKYPNSFIQVVTLQRWSQMQFPVTIVVHMKRCNIFILIADHAHILILVVQAAFSAIYRKMFTKLRTKMFYHHGIFFHILSQDQAVELKFSSHGQQRLQNFTNYICNHN